MTAAALRHAMAEARRFLAAAEELELKGERWGREAEHFQGSALTARVKRASLDLTKALPPLRRPS